MFIYTQKNVKINIAKIIKL